MNALERLAAAGKTNSVGTHTFIDADTIRNPDGGPNFRLQGYDAPEVAGFKGKPGEQQWHAGTAGAADATREITALAETQGYNNLVKLLDDNGNPVLDPHGRQIVELHDADGRNFTTELLKSGALEAGTYVSQDDLDAIDAAKAFGNNNDAFSTAAEKVQGAIEKETWRDIQFRQQAINERQYAGGGGTSALSFKHNDRSLSNVSNQQAWDAWEQGLIGAKEGYYGFLELLGDTAGLDELQDIGEAGIARAQSQQAEYAEILTDWRDVKGFDSGVKFIANNALMSLPYMIASAGSVAAGTVAAPFVGAAVGSATAGAAIAGGLSTLPTAMIYAGQTWNEMEEVEGGKGKSAAVALSAGLAQAALDRLGITAIKGKVLPKNFADEAVKKIMKTGVPREQAEKMFANATKFELAEVLKAGGRMATAKANAWEATKTLIASGLSEGATEVAQEATAYLAAVEGSDKEFDPEELYERVIAAAIAGGTLGAGFSVPGTVKNLASQRALLGDNALADETTGSASAIYAQQELDNVGHIATNAENLATIHNEIAAEAPGWTLAERGGDFRKAQRGRTAEEKVRDAFNAIPSLWRGATRNVFTDDILSKSRSARIAADLYGGNPDRVFSGASFEDAKHHRVAQYKNMIPIPEKIFSIMNDGNPFTDSDKARFSDQIYTTLQAAVNKEGIFDPNAVPEGKFKQTIIKMGNDLNALSDKMYADQKKHNPELGYIKNYLFKYKTMDKRAVHKNRAKFEKALRDVYKMDVNEAKEITNRIVDDPNVGDIDEAFSVVKGGIVPSSHKKRSLGLSEKKEFQEFLQQDLFANVAHAAKSAARYTAHRDFIGKNGEVPAKLLQKIQNELGNTPEAIAIVDKMAAQMQDYLDAESGNYKRPKTKTGEQAQKIQKNVMMFMTLSGLPLATFSSFVEAALVGRGLKPEQIFGKDKISLKSQGNDLANGMIKAVFNFSDAVQGKTAFTPDTENQARVRDLGFYEWDVGAATVTGVTEVNARSQKTFDAFFKANGLTQWTDYTRSLRASFAGDFMSNHTQEISAQRRAGRPYTREIQEKEQQLRNLGINIDRFLPIQEKVGAGLPLDPQEQAFYDEQVRDMTFNFVNEAIVLPQSANRPLLYQDPRFALFTQFQGFLSTFTTKVLPKLWRDATGGSTPSMQYGAWATMATMIMLGFASQYAKDWLKYGFDPDDDEDFQSKTLGNPYLDQVEYIQRGLLSTGLLGTGERVVSTLFPIYEQRHDGLTDWAFNSIVGESPALGWAERVAGAGGQFAGGNISKGVEQSLKATPFFGPFSSVNRELSEALGEWNFNGE